MMKASQMIWMLVDKMADCGDFDVNPGFFESFGRDNAPVQLPPECPINKARQQGLNAANHPKITLEHNPYPADSEEAAAWADSFNEMKGN